MISIIIPVYNSALYLERCVDSILNQTYRDLEVILVDDGSTDGSGDICDRYAFVDSRVKIIHTENRGVSVARNTGMSMAHGEYLSFIDSDDWIDPRFCELLYNALEEKGCDMAMCHFSKVWNNEFSTSKSSDKMVYAEEITNSRLYDMLLAIPIDTYRNSSLPYDVIWGKLYRRNILNDLYFMQIYAEDAEFNSRLYMRVKKAAVINEPLYVWIQYPQSLHRQPSYDNLDGLLRVNIQMYRNLLPEYEKEKGQALKRIFLGVLSSRYFLSHYPEFEPSRTKVESLIKDSVDELLPVLFKRRDVSVIFKIGVAIFYYLPFTYNLFRLIAAKYPKILG